MNTKVKINELIIEDFSSAYISASGDAYVSIENLTIAKSLFNRFQNEEIQYIAICNENGEPIMELTPLEKVQVKLDTTNKGLSLRISGRGESSWL